MQIFIFFILLLTSRLLNSSMLPLLVLLLLLLFLMLLLYCLNLGGRVTEILILLDSTLFSSSRVQGDQLIMAVFFWYPISSDLSDVNFDRFFFFFFFQLNFKHNKAIIKNIKLWYRDFIISVACCMPLHWSGIQCSI